MVVEARHGVIDTDSLGPSRHVGWITAQYTANLRYDLLIFTEYRNAFRSDNRVAAGFAVRRKSDRVDVQSGVTVDISHGALEPGFTVASRVAAQVGVIGAIVVRADPPLYIGPRRLNASLTAQWFYASDR